MLKKKVGRIRVNVKNEKMAMYWKPELESNH